MDNRAKESEPGQSPAMDEEEEEEEEEMEEVPAETRFTYSLVCYGLPNLAVVPSKN